MHLYITLVILPVLSNYAATETPRDPSKEIRQISTIKPQLNDVVTPIDLGSPDSSNTLQHNPANAHTVETEDYKIRQVIPNPPRALTKLTKTMYTGFNPFFSKDSFEPFERRNKPVTLITFRKNGFVPRNTIKVTNSKSAEVAELQSPYNDISTFWKEEPYQTLQLI